MGTYPSLNPNGQWLLLEARTLLAWFIVVQFRMAPMNKHALTDIETLAIGT